MVALEARLKGMRQWIKVRYRQCKRLLGYIFTSIFQFLSVSSYLVAKRLESLNLMFYLKFNVPRSFQPDSSKIFKSVSHMVPGISQRGFCQMISSKDILRCVISSVCEDLELKTDHWRGFAIGSGPSFQSSSPGSYFMTFEALTCQQRWKVTVDSRYWQYSVGLLCITQTLEWIFKKACYPVFSPQIWENAPLTIKCWDNI